MKREFFCKLCWCDHPIHMLYEESHPSRLQCKDSVKKIGLNKLNSYKQEIKAETKKTIVDEINQAKLKTRRSIEQYNERRELNKLDDLGCEF